MVHKVLPADGQGGHLFDSLLLGSQASLAGCMEFDNSCLFSSCRWQKGLFGNIPSWPAMEICLFSLKKSFKINVLCLEWKVVEG